MRTQETKTQRTVPALGKRGIKVALAPWAEDILCDPLSKTRLKRSDGYLLSDYGRRYPIVDGIYDLRALDQHRGAIAEKWKAGQEAYENWSEDLAIREAEDHAAQRAGVEAVYRAIPIEGRVLDIGGNDGRLRAFLDHGQEYMSLDPFISVPKEWRPAVFFDVYPFMVESLNFVASMAEQIPVVSSAADTVHIRSALDHFQDPELALREAYRVLRPQGVLVVGLLVRGGKSGREDMATSIKEIVRAALVGLGLSKFADHHVWHPTYTELCAMISECGFKVDKTHWQASERERVCYIRAMKT